MLFCSTVTVVSCCVLKLQQEPLSCVTVTPDIVKLICMVQVPPNVFLSICCHMQAPWDVPADDYVSYKANLRHYRSAVAAGDCTEVRGHLQAVHLQRLAPSVWLNDEVINHRMLQLNVLNGQLQSQSSDVTKCHFFSSYFMASLLLNQRNKGNVNYDAVSRWGFVQEASPCRAGAS